MRRILLIVMGALILGGGFLHASGFPALRAEFVKANVPEALQDAPRAVWFFTSGAMFTLGAIVLTCALQMRKNPAVIWNVRWLALFYIAFGTWGYFGFHHSVHLGMFAIIGLVTGLGALGSDGPKLANG